MQTICRMAGIRALALFCLCLVDVAPYLPLQAQRSDVKVQESFLDQRSCPLHAIRSSGSVLLLKNAAKKRIAKFGVVCLHQHGSEFKIIQTFSVEDPVVEPGAFTTVGIGFDSTPLNYCRADGGLLGISEVVFSDGSRWKSRWTEKPLTQEIPNTK